MRTQHNFLFKWFLPSLLILLIGTTSSAELDQDTYNEAVRYTSAVAYDRGANYYDASQIGHDAVANTWIRHRDEIFENGLDTRLRAYLAAVARHRVIDLYRHERSDLERNRAYKDVHDLVPDRWHNGQIVEALGGNVGEYANALEYLEWIESLEPVDQKMWVSQTEGASERSLVPQSGATYHETRERNKEIRADFAKNFDPASRPDLESMSNVHEKKGLASRSWGYVDENVGAIIGWGLGGVVGLFLLLVIMGCFLDDSENSSPQSNGREAVASTKQNQQQVFDPIDTAPRLNPDAIEKLAQSSMEQGRRRRAEEQERWLVVQQVQPKAMTAQSAN